MSAVAKAADEPMQGPCPIPGSLVLLGDSITQMAFSPGGFASRLAEYFVRRLDVVNRGFSGYNTEWIRHALPTIFPATGCPEVRCVFIFFGANDAALPDQGCQRQHVPLSTYQKNLRAIVDCIKSTCPNSVQILVTPPPIDADQRLAWQVTRYGEKATGVLARTNEVAGQYAQACVDLASDMEIPVVDLWTEMQKHEGWAKFLCDGLHLSAEGNLQTFELMRQTIETAFPELAVTPDQWSGSFSNSGSTSQLQQQLPWHDELAPDTFASHIDNHTRITK